MTDFIEQMIAARKAADEMAVAQHKQAIADEAATVAAALAPWIAQVAEALGDQGMKEFINYEDTLFWLRAPDCLPIILPFRLTSLDGSALDAWQVGKFSTSLQCDAPHYRVWDDYLEESRSYPTLPQALYFARSKSKYYSDQEEYKAKHEPAAAARTRRHEFTLALNQFALMESDTLSVLTAIALGLGAILEHLEANTK